MRSLLDLATAEVCFLKCSVVIVVFRIFKKKKCLSLSHQLNSVSNIKLKLSLIFPTYTVK